MNRLTIHSREEMTILFPTDEWAKAAMVEVNRSSKYQEAAKNWEGDIIFQVTAVPSRDKAVFLYMDLSDRYFILRKPVTQR